MREPSQLVPQTEAAMAVRSPHRQIRPARQVRQVRQVHRGRQRHRIRQPTDLRCAKLSVFVLVALRTHDLREHSTPEPTETAAKSATTKPAAGTTETAAGKAASRAGSGSGAICPARPAPASATKPGKAPEKSRLGQGCVQACPNLLLTDRAALIRVPFAEPFCKGAAKFGARHCAICVAVGCLEKALREGFHHFIPAALAATAKTAEPARAAH